MPKKQKIGGCAGTRYGCCPNGVTPKMDEQGSNCNVKQLLIIKLKASHLNYKTYELENNADFGDLIVNIENHHNKSLLSINYVPSDSAKKNGLTKKSFSCKIKFNNLSKKWKDLVRDYLNNLVNGIIPSGKTPKSFSFFSTILTRLMTKMSHYLIHAYLTHSYVSITFDFPKFTTCSMNTATSSPTYPNWEIGAIMAALAAAFMASVAYWKQILEPIHQYIFDNYGGCPDGVGGHYVCQRKTNEQMHQEQIEADADAEYEEIIEFDPYMTDEQYEEFLEAEAEVKIDEAKG